MKKQYLSQLSATTVERILLERAILLVVKIGELRVRI